eukprot:CAMPEP_0118962376 /NCGR_PEP_ID=MMETSP1173-20130426/737_1 /TAXON_ID=1034831 /ORGANISM="Rhizochromulina marina cf, Strain CCMP1243" /LENGTH=88 /DNA_ID=CAMNT_0006910633 /DNA_START=42 /DNA_END=305 /DNA_ORIENTATION=+
MSAETQRVKVKCQVWKMRSLRSLALLVAPSCAFRMSAPLPLRKVAMASTSASGAAPEQFCSIVPYFTVADWAAAEPGLAECVAKTKTE